MLNNALRGFLPSSKKRTDRKNAFDLQYGTDTSGIVRIASMDVASPNYVYARYYKASTIEYLQQALHNVPVAHERFTFVDFGSGKGLALMAAAFYPFRRIIGVEFAADLHKTAKANLEKFQAPGKQCKAVESVHADVTEWTIPSDPLVCYFYEPFEAPVLTKVIRNLECSYSAVERPILLIYHQPPTTSVLYEEALANEEAILRRGVFSKIDSWQHHPYVLYSAGRLEEAATRDGLAGR